MKTALLWIAGALVLSLSLSAFSQSLGDLAKKEKERREAVKTDSKVITNEKASKSLGTVTTEAPPMTHPAPTQEKAGSEVEKAATENEKTPSEPDADVKPKKDSEEPVDFQGRPESYWRQTFADARKRVKDLENQTNVIILKLNDLNNQFYKESDGFKQQQIQREIQKTFFEQDATKEALEKAKGDVVDLEREARKSGALPGWIRDKNE
jgi:hypothetical protein